MVYKFYTFPTAYFLFFSIQRLMAVLQGVLLLYQMFAQIVRIFLGVTNKLSFWFPCFALVKIFPSKWCIMVDGIITDQPKCSVFWWLLFWLLLLMCALFYHLQVFILYQSRLFLWLSTSTTLQMYLVLTFLHLAETRFLILHCNTPHKVFDQLLF